MKLLRPENVAKDLGISPHTLSNWRANGKGPSYVNLGGKIKYREPDVTEWIESRIRRIIHDAPKAALPLLGEPAARPGRKERFGGYRTHQDRRDELAARANQKPI